MLTQQLLKDCVDYDPQTGVFTCKNSTSSIRLDKRYNHLVITISGRQYQAHRLVFLFLFGSIPKYNIRHKNGIRFDNRFTNLEKVRAEFDILTQDFLKSRLYYDKNTGIFTYLKKVSNNTNIGDIAGSIHKTGYNVIIIAGRSYKSHRLAFLWMNGSFPKKDIDHINGNKLDNRWENIREATKSENNKNSPRRKDNKSGICGVYWNPLKEEWRATIYNNKKHILLGNFKDINDAISARKQAEKEFGFHPNHGR